MEKYYRLSKKERNGTRVFGDYINERAHDKRLLGKDYRSRQSLCPYYAILITYKQKVVYYQ